MFEACARQVICCSVTAWIEGEDAGFMGCKRVVDDDAVNL
jgi:hypothetical protein